ncbi:pre-mRNA-splicing factor Spp2p [[Candida] railenensis]|uniref:Pre-mRNA-splicing factor n=1 Tax=[Candida] railenensis TaxID=45579 RepID=A0A9P0W162_9ASCO|nr:pre-mRNA-splicing factor Spp2p [[Candida] railenensis]
MSGFKFNLKGKPATKSKVIKPIKLGGALKGKQPLKKTNIRLEQHDSDSDSDSEKVVSIDSFGKSGASQGNISVDSKAKHGPLVIKQQHASDWKSKLKAKSSKIVDGPKESESSELSDDQLIRQSLISGEKLETENGLVINVNDKAEEADNESYDTVPVEQFGAAMLRGMGWKPTRKGKNSTDADLNKKVIESRQRSAMLGIGAKEVESELMNSKLKTFEVPIIKRLKDSGEAIHNK